MPLFEDRVRDTSSTTGTGNFTLDGAPPTGAQSFNAAFGTGVRFYYTIQDQTGSDWETGEGYLSASTTLVRDIVRASSNSNALVNFTAATDVWCDAIADAFNTQASTALVLRYAVS